VKPRIYEVFVLVALSAACSGDARPPEKAAATESPCSVLSLRTLLASDSSKLRRANRAAPGQSSEGGEAAVFYAGITPRLIRLQYFGEMGKAQEMYYLRDSLSFVRIRTEYAYARPLPDEHNPSISSIKSDTVWACGGRPQFAADSIVIRQSLATVRQLLRTP
jgi:hypothetical protein